MNLTLGCLQALKSWAIQSWCLKFGHFLEFGMASTILMVIPKNRREFETYFQEGMKLFYIGNWNIQDSFLIIPYLVL